MMFKITDKTLAAIAGKKINQKTYALLIFISSTPQLESYSYRLIIIDLFWIHNFVSNVLGGHMIMLILKSIMLIPPLLFIVAMGN